MLSATRKADRTKMAKQLVELVEREGFSAIAKPDDKDIVVRITAGSAVVGVRIGAIDAKSGFIVPWNTAVGDPARFSNDFGIACQATVNQHHRAKCMGLYHNWDQTLDYVESALICIREGRAFE